MYIYHRCWSFGFVFGIFMFMKPQLPSIQCNANRNFIIVQFFSDHSFCIILLFWFLSFGSAFFLLLSVFRSFSLLFGLQTKFSYLYIFYSLCLVWSGSTSDKRDVVFFLCVEISIFQENKCRNPIFFDYASFWYECEKYIHNVHMGWNSERFAKITMLKFSLCFEQKRKKWNYTFNSLYFTYGFVKRLF